MTEEEVIRNIFKQEKSNGATEFFKRLINPGVVAATLAVLIFAWLNYLDGGLGGELAALIFAIGALILAIGCVVAWLTFAIVRIRERRSEKLEK